MKKNSTIFKKLLFVILIFLILFSIFFFLVGNSKKHNEKQNIAENTYTINDNEKEYLKKKFDDLSSINKDTIAYIYIPGTKLDEPVVQTNDNTTYLDKTFEGKQQPFFGTVFMDKDNKSDFSDKLTWLFGHARGSQVSDNRMFNDVNFYDNKDFFDSHPFVVVETPKRRYYYQVSYFLIVPETTPLYKNSFKDDEEFEEQIKLVSETAIFKNPNIKINPKDKYLVLSTCREEDSTLRANLYLRLVPDDELKDFLSTNSEKIKYKKTR